MSWKVETFDSSEKVKDFIAGRLPEDVILAWPDGNMRVFYKDVPADAGNTWALSSEPSDVNVKDTLSQLELGGSASKTKVIGFPQQGYRIFVSS
jgi:hypothetical protein